MKGEAALVDQPRLGQALRQHQSGDEDLSRQAGLQPARGPHRSSRISAALGLTDVSQARDDPFRQTAPDGGEAFYAARPLDRVIGRLALCFLPVSNDEASPRD